MKRFIQSVLIAAIFMTPGALCAQDMATQRELSIQKALQIALDNNPTLNAERQELNKAKGTLVQAQGNFYPSLTISGDYSDGRYPSVSNGWRSDSAGAGVTLSQNLYAGGKHAALRRQARETLSQTALSVQEAEEALAVQVYSAFYGVLLARETVAAASDAVETSRKHVLEVRQLLRLGLANQLELIRAEQQLSSNEASLASCRGTYDTQRIGLLNLMGLAPDSGLLPSGSLKIPTPEGTPASSIILARRQRPDVAVLEKQIAIQNEEIKIARSGMKPSLDLSVSADYDNPYHNQDRGDNSWEATLSIEIPLYDRGQTRGDIMKAKAQQEQNKRSLQQKELDILSEVQLAWIEIEDSALEVEACRKALSLAKESLRLSQVGYREGVTPQLDLLEAQSNLTAARKDYSQALYDHLIKVAGLKRAEGELILWTLEETNK